MANNKIREEEVKNRIRQEFFQEYGKQQDT